MHGRGDPDREWLIWGLANNGPILGVMYPSPVKGYPYFELPLLTGGIHRCLSSTLGL